MTSIRLKSTPVRTLSSPGREPMRHPWLRNIFLRQCCSLLPYAALMACATQPPHAQPYAALPPSWANGAADPFASSVPSATGRGDWWIVLKDPAIDNLIKRALASNPTLEAALARVDQASAQIATDRAAQRPQVSLGAGIGTGRSASIDTDGMTPSVSGLRILSAIPLSAGGAFVALLIARSELDVPAMIGLVMLTGIVTKNSILLLEYAVLGMSERHLTLHKALIDACHKRARPIIMTTIAMIAGMTPIALGLGADASFRQPMAIAVIGGLLTSTALSLLVVPVVFTYIATLEAALRRFFAPARRNTIAAPSR